MTPAFDWLDELPQLAALAARYVDRHPDLADLCLIRLSELHPRHTVITTDIENFRVSPERARNDSAHQPSGLTDGQ